MKRIATRFAPARPPVNLTLRVFRTDAGRIGVMAFDANDQAQLIRTFPSMRQATKFAARCIQYRWPR